MAVGFMGYKLKRDGSRPRHPEGMVYIDSVSLVDQEFEYVDVLGGITGIAYKPCFFHLDLLKQINGPSFYVDDDWISVHLEKSNIKKIVAGMKSIGASTAHEFATKELLIGSIATLDALNSEKHMFRNINFQEAVLQGAISEGLFV
jgi:hypothetical protein